jgi:hypothetical protein
MIEFIDDNGDSLRFERGSDIQIVGENNYTHGIRCFVEAHGMHMILSDRYSLLLVMEKIVSHARSEHS